MRAAEGEYTDVAVDGIPLGSDFGLCVERESVDPILLRSPLEAQTSYRGVRFRKYLTHERNGQMVKVRELPPDAVCSARRGDTTVYV